MKPKKYLGQNFLKSKIIANQIIQAANVQKNDVVLEVGPGRGILTEILVQKAKKIIAIEKDKELADFLMDKFKNLKNLSIIHDDILKFQVSGFRLQAYKIVANIPYYITSHFLRKFLESEYQPSLMALMVQKEVAERIIAKDGKESILSISVKAYGQPEVIATVPARFFSPAPKVDSAIILIKNISRDFFVQNKITEEKFFKILKQGFCHKRKLLKKNLTISEKVLEKCGIPSLARAEELSLKNWKCLSSSY